MSGVFLPDLDKGCENCKSILLFFLVALLGAIIVMLAKPTPLELEPIPRIKLIGNFEKIEYTFVDGKGRNWSSGSHTYRKDATNITYEFPMTTETHALQWKIKARWVIDNQRTESGFTAYIDDMKYSAIHFNGVTHGIRHCTPKQNNPKQEPQYKWFFSEVVRDTSVTGEIVLRSEKFPNE